MSFIYFAFFFLRFFLFRLKSLSFPYGEVEYDTYGSWHDVLAKKTIIFSWYVSSFKYFASVFRCLSLFKNSLFLSLPFNQFFSFYFTSVLTTSADVASWSEWLARTWRLWTGYCAVTQSIPVNSGRATGARTSPTWITFPTTRPTGGCERCVMACSHFTSVIHSFKI